MSQPKEKQPSPILPWRPKLYCYLSTALAKLTVRKDGTINRRFDRFLDPKLPPNKNPRNGVSTTDVTVDPTTNLWFRLFTPVTPTAVKLPVIFFFHGGAFSFLAPSSRGYDVFCRRLAREISAVIVSVNYRLSPEHRFPAPYDDGERVLKWVAENASTCLPETADVSRCFLAGDSAGGNIVHHVGIRVAAAVDDFRPLRLAGIIAIQPFFGGEERVPSELRLTRVPIVNVEGTDWHWKAFLPEDSDRDHPAANVFGPKSPDISGMDFPATLVVVGGFDPLQDWQRRYCEGLKRCGKSVELVEYPNVIHSFYIFKELPEGSMLISEMKAFIEKHGK